MRYFARHVVGLFGAILVLTGSLTVTKSVMAANEELMSHLRHICVAKYLEAGTYDRFHCEMDDVTNSRTVLPVEEAIRYCATTRLVLMLGDQAARGVEALVCDSAFSASTLHADGTPVLVDGELFWPAQRRLADRDGNIWFSTGSSASRRDQINYRGGATFKSSDKMFYESGVLFRVESTYYHPSAGIAVTGRGILYYPNGLVAGAVDGAGVDIFYPNGNPARFSRQLFCPQDSTTVRSNTSGNILTDSCTLRRICSPAAPEDICRKKDFYRPEPQLEALAAMKILSDINP